MAESKFPWYDVGDDGQSDPIKPAIRNPLPRTKDRNVYPKHFAHPIKLSIPITSTSDRGILFYLSTFTFNFTKVNT